MMSVDASRVISLCANAHEIWRWFPFVFSIQFFSDMMNTLHLKFDCRKIEDCIDDRDLKTYHIYPITIVTYDFIYIPCL